MTVVMAPPYLSEEARRDWELLQEPTAGARPFDPGRADLLPESARRWVLRAIAPGTPLLRGVVLTTRGTIRLNAWRDFHATQVLVPLEGFVWTAATRRGMLPVRGFDRYRAGTGETRWRALDTFPVMSGTGPDVSRSAAGRLACELVLAPAAALDPRVRWKGLDDRQALASVPVGGEDHDVLLVVDEDGRLESVTVSRWGAPDGGPYQWQSFGVVCEGEAAFDGFTIPEGVRGGWWPGTPRWEQGEFIRFVVGDAVYR
ncbi:hypothetical protein SAMN05444920_114135 [Nonomuraea solani]|uniref:Uncharacterized protein n=1 Tax=Nonomuraea solani TaxID=1144553 RepID=A0A1H6ESQ0_9ACTN|nr:DUF6544 family protein [Nonomuraea solani]SEG99859.1 hypothetical protein SAMN05444920_114135 [Nonomuraea solani]